MQKIREAIIDAQTYGYHLEKGTHRFFIVDKFYETDFKTIARGKKIFDIREVLGIRDNDLPPVSEIAELLKGKTWK